MDSGAQRWRAGWRAAGAVALLWLGGAARADEAEFAARVRADTQWLADFGTRQVGTPEHARLQEALLARLRALPNVTVWTQEFPVVAPCGEEAFLELEGGRLAGRHRIFPFWPDVARLNTTPAAGLRGRLLYVGDAAFERLPARSLQGHIAVMELSAYADYRRVFDYGAAAVLVLESEPPGEAQPSQQPLYKPRYYVPAGPLADALRAGEAAEGRIVCRGRWQTVTARNLYAGVKPPGAAAAAPYLVLAPYDSMSQVLGVAPGADAALDCATALNVLREEAQRPTRPLLFGFVDAYHINQLGLRYLAATLTVTPQDQTRRAYAKLEAADLEDYRAAAEELARFESADAGLAALHERRACRHLRRLFKDAVGPELLRLSELQGQLRLAARRSEAENAAALRLGMLAALDRASAWLLERHGDELTPPERAELDAARAFAAADRQRRAAAGQAALPLSAAERDWAGFGEARARAERLLPICGRLLRARNRILEAAYTGRWSEAAEHLPLARALWARMAARVRGQLAEQERRAAFFDPLDRLRGEIAAGFGLHRSATDTAVCAFAVGLDLSDCGVLVGPGAMCGYHRLAVSNREFTRALKRAVQQGALWPEGAPERRAVNLDAIQGRVGGAAEQGGGRALITAAAQSFLLPGVTWMTDDALRPAADSPLDRGERLRWERIEPQLAATRRFLEWLFTTPEPLSAPKRGDEIAAPWRHGMGRIVDISAGETVPRVPRAGFLVTLIGYTPDRDGIRRHEFAWTAEDGSFRLPLLCGDVHPFHKNAQMAAYRLDADGAIVETLSTRESLVTTRLSTSFNLGSKPGEQLPRAVTFPCAELNGPSFFDVRFLEPLRQGSLLDAVRGGAPKRLQFGVDGNGQMWGAVDPEIRWQLLMRSGAARTRLALLNAVPDGRERGLTLRETFKRGFAVGEPLPSLAAHVGAQDLATLDDWRLADFRAAGIKSEKIDALRLATRQALESAAAARARDDGGALQRAAVQALAHEIRAYQAVKDLGEDIARGAIFLMLMLVPFCVAMERLLFACARIGRQIVAALAIFAAMTALLWSFHPAFRISAQPLVIVMAFTILALSVVVICIVLSRFKAAVREFQSALAEDSGAKMGRGGLLASAVFLGIANMRKRKVRTLLTGATVILVTFALLCFSSASSYVDRKDFRIEGVRAAAPSVLVRRPSSGPLAWDAAPALRNLLGAEGVAVGERVWLCGGLAETTWRLYLANPRTGAQAPVRGALGLPPIEDRLSGADRVLTNWPAFAAAGGCYLAPDTAAQLGVREGETVVVRGRELTVRGIFDPLRLEDEVRLLDGQRILPYDYSRQEQDWLDRNSQAAIEQETASAEAMQPAGDDSERYVPAREVAILPAETLRALGGTLRSLGVACAGAAQAAAVADRLTQTIVYPAYYANAQGGVNVLVATPLVALPPKQLAIPLAIAALIIFTTMLNSVSERKGEIYVYTSLGLAPVHVGALFVAEALTYGLMGAVFGYVAGQGTATVLTRLGWMQGVTLNYSGTAVIKTMLLVQGVVALSAVVPALLAGRVAAPSTEVDWKVPLPVDGVIRDLLPFTVSPQAAPGLIAFIHEYLEAHRDGVLGRFDVDEVRLLPPDAAGCVAGLESRVWLAPFDMGVRQGLRLTVLPPQDEACAIAVELRHETGTPKVWWRLNKPFLFELRRQFLGWRKVKPERVLQYLERAGFSAGPPAAAVKP